MDGKAVNRPEKAMANYRLIEKHLEKWGQAVSFMAEKLTDEEKNDVIVIEGTYSVSYTHLILLSGEYL